MIPRVSLLSLSYIPESSTQGEAKPVALMIISELNRHDVVIQIFTTGLR